MNAHEYAQTHTDQFKAAFIDLLRIPSVSTLIEHAEDVQLAASWIAEQIKQIGMERAEIFQKDGFLPLVYGEWLGAGDDAPTILIYCHYDVQPAEIEDGWETHPFDPTEIDGKIYARGALDSKCHVVAHLKAIESFLADEDRPAVNLKLIFEGEEESGSEHIFSFLREQKNRDLLQADVCVVSDGSHPDPNQPVLVYGLRGIITMELVVTGPQRDLHSGHYGGTVHNPIQALSEMLAKLHNDEGSVTVPGFYDDVRTVDEEERERLLAIRPLVEAEWYGVAGAPAPWGEQAYALHERLGTRPTLEINGIAGGFYGDGFKTVLPARAMAKVSCRLVPDQDPQRIQELLQEHIAAITPQTVTSELILLEIGSPGVVLDYETPSMQAAIRAYELGWGAKPILSREGGSVPVVSSFQQELNLPVVMLPFGYKGGGAHSTNEFMYEAMFHKGVETAIHFYQQFATMKG